MKNLMAKLKGMDYKQFALNYADKIGFGVIAVIVLGVLVMGTNKDSYEKTPTQFEDAAAKATQALANSTWPETDKGQFRVEDFSAKAEERVLRDVALNNYEYRIEMSPKLYPREAQVKEPTLFPVRDLIATYGTAPIETFPPELQDSLQLASAANDEKKAAEEKAPKKASNEFELAKGSTGGGQAGTGVVVPMPPVGPAQGTAISLPVAPTGYGAADVEDGVPGMGIGIESTSVGLNRHGRGLRYVAVRGIVPHKELMESYKQALHTPTREMAAEHVVYWDFHIERQMAVGGPEQWTPWTQLKIEVARDAINNECAIWDPEIVNINVTDPVFTMPLPGRLMGNWSVHGTHPALEDYLLSQTQIEEERIKSEEALAKDRAKGAVGVTKKGGFAGSQGDAGSARRRTDTVDAGAVGAGRGPGMPFSMPIPGGMPGPNMANMPVGNIGTVRGGPADMEDMSMPGFGGTGLNPADDDLRRNPNPTTEAMLLFRYFDFDIEPGRVYRYRIQLVMGNTNFDKRPEQVEKPEVAQGRTRETKWSDESNPVLVNEDMNYFLSRVLRTRGSAGMAEMDTFQWDAASGVIIHAPLKLTYGQPVGGKARLEFPDVIHEVLDTKEVAFYSRDILVDSNPAPVLATADHPDLKVRDLARLLDGGTLDEAITVNQFGEFVENNPVVTQAEESVVSERHKNQNDALKSQLQTKTPDADAPSTLDGLAGGMGDPMDSKKKKAKKKGNPTRMMGMPGMPGMPMPGMPGMPAGGADAKAKKTTKSKR